MKLEKIREMTETELNNEVKKLKNELFNLRFQHVTGHLKTPSNEGWQEEIARVKP